MKKAALIWGCWLALLLLGAAYLSWQLPQRHWSSSITAAFPGTDADWQRDLVANHSANRQIRLAFTGLSEAQLAEVAAAFQLQNPELHWVTPEQHWQQLQGYYQRAAGLIATKAANQQLAEKQYQSLTDNAWQQLLSPLPLADNVLERDPLLLSQAAMQQTATGLSQQFQALTPAAGWLQGKFEQQPFVLLQAELAIDPFDSELAVPLHGKLMQQLQLLQQQYPELRWHHSGLLFHAVKAASTAKAEMSWYGGLSMLAIVLLLWWVFASAKPLLLAVITLGSAALAGLTAVVWFFESPHLLAFVFATTLIGVAIDYSFHGLLAVQQGPAFFRRMLPGLSLSLLSTLLGYAALLLLPLTILNQVAVFMLAGLTAAYLMVCFVYPVALAPKSLHVASSARRGASLLVRFWQRFNQRQAWTLFVTVAISSALLFLLQVKFSDDVRGFNQLDPLLQQHEQQIIKLSGQQWDNKFLLVSAETTEQLLEREAQLRSLLQAWQQQGLLRDWQAVADWLPTIAAQRQLQQQLQAAYQSAVGQQFLQQLGVAVPQPLAQWLTATDLPDFVQQQLYTPVAGKGAPAKVSVILLRGSTLGKTQLAHLSQLGFAERFDPIEDASTKVAGVRHLLSIGLAAAVLVAILLLGWYYGVKRAVAITLFLQIAVCSALNISLLLGQALTLFHLVGVLLVVALALDYAIFFASKLAAEEVQLAVGLSAITSMLAFGMLAFSQTPVIAGFGLTILVGILVAVLIAPLLTRIGGMETQRR